MNITSLVINIRVTVNHKPDIAVWRVRWAYRLARLFGLPLDVEVEKPQ